MIPGMKQSDINRAMKQMGIKQEEIEADEVIIKCGDKEIVISNPNVTKVRMMGQESFQITGEINERSSMSVSDEDIETVMEKAGVSKEEARKSLEKAKGDLAEAILNLKS